MKRRKAARENQWFFDSPVNKGEHLTNPRKQWVKISDWLGTKVRNHTLRRTFASAADLCGIPLDTRARMLNHKAGSMINRRRRQQVHLRPLRLPSKVYGAGRPMDMMENSSGLPTYPQAQ